jgi:hypothetical protein
MRLTKEILELHELSLTKCRLAEVGGDVPQEIFNVAGEVTPMTNTTSIPTAHGMGCTKSKGVADAPIVQHVPMLLHEDSLQAAFITLKRA